MKVLSTENEAKIADFVRVGLKEQGFTVDYRRTQILEHIWGYDFNHSPNAVNVCIKQIRQKIDSINRLSWIGNVCGFDYRFRQGDLHQ